MNAEIEEAAQRPAARSKAALRSVFIVTLIACTSSLCGSANGDSTSIQRPATQIDLSSVGYEQFSQMARRSGAANVSLDFIDRDHVLFTFNSKKLVRRLPDCPPTHDDRMVHAAIFEVSSSRVLRQTDWYLHDSRPYVWTLGSGRMLLRKANSLFVLDSNLSETTLWTSPDDLLWVSVTPDGKQIFTETSKEASPSARNGSKSRIQIEFRDADSLAVQRVIRSAKVANMEAVSSGFASVVAGASGRVWLVRFGPGEQQRANIARVRTRRVPDILYPSSNTLLIGRDSSKVPGYSVSMFTVTGNRLWQQRWNAHRYYPTLARSENGSRFAVGTLALVDSSLPPVEGEQMPEGLLQGIEVLDTASGTHVFSTSASPVVLQGHNFALSPDGSRLAVLRGGVIDFYELPPMSTEEKAKYSAVQADVPGLYIAPADQDSSAGPSVFTFASETEEAENAAGGDSPNAADTSPSSEPATSAAASFLTGTSLSNETGLSTPGSTLTLKTSTQVVTLDVVVTDANGHTVKNVPRDDFRVLEEGKPQALTFFEEVKANPAASKPVTQQNEVAPNIFTNRSPAPETESVALIVYDLLNTPADQQQRAKLELLKFLQNKPKNSRFALCALSDSLQMIQGFTPDEALLMRAAKGQKGSLRYTSQQNQDAQDQQTIAWLAQGSMKLLGRYGTASRGMLDAAARLEEDMSERRDRDLNLRTWMTVDAFAQLARYLSAIPGRKSLIWLSGSFPLGTFPGVDLRNSDSTTGSYMEQVKRAVNLLAESHIAVYPVDVRGLTAYSWLTPTFTNSADSTQPSASSQSLFNPSSGTRRFNQLGNVSRAGDIGANLPGGDSPFMQEATDHGIMDRIAADTGGKAFYNTNRLEQAMAIATEQETNYYALSYTPSNRKYDGKFRKIKVTLTGNEKKLHLIHRSGYFALDPATANQNERDAANGFGLAAMQHGSPQANQIFIAARIAPLGKGRKVDPKTPGLRATSQKAKHGKGARPDEPVEVQRYLVDYAITPSHLRFEITPEGAHHAVINFMSASFDEDGALRASIVSRVVTNLTPESYNEILTGGFRVRQQVDVPVRAAWMRLGVQDAMSGRMGTIEIPLPSKALPGVEQMLAERMPDIEPD